MRVKLFLFFLIIVGFFYRFHGLGASHPFWIDEFSTGQFAAAIVRTGSPRTVTGLIEVKNLLNHYITAFSMKAFGINEFAARLPSVLWGTLMIAAVYFVFQKIFNKKVGLAVAVLTTFSAIEITWSRQARSYALFQLVYLLTVYCFWRLFEKIKVGEAKNKDIVIPVLLLLITLLAHVLAVTIILAVVVYVLLFARKGFIGIVKKLKREQRTILVIFLIVSVFLIWQAGMGGVFRPLKFYNNLWYYHSFLWRQYALISFLAFLGLLSALFSRKKRHCFLVIVLVVHLAFVTFFVRWIDVRYLYSVFPIFFFAYLAYFFDGLTRLWLRNILGLQKFLFFFLIFFLVVNGHKFTLKPRNFYSPNADMKEIPLVDYHLAYKIIKGEIARSGQTVVVIDTWGDRIAWYLGRDYPNAFWIREFSQFGGYRVENGEKKDNAFNFGAITNKDELLHIIETSPTGFVFIDGHEIPFLPKDALEYIENNLKLEKEFSLFSLDPDPYDTWPAWLYSWGCNYED